MSRLSCLMTVYNEIDFVDYAIRGCLPYVDDLVIVEGSYNEIVNLGGSRRSSDGTVDIIEKYRNNKKVHIIYNDEGEPPESDKDQRNIGLKKIKELNSDGWCIIVDADEVYDKNNFSMVKVAMHNMEKSDKLAAYFKSLTFVNDLDHFTEQDFPRLFRITKDCKFINDNFMTWPDKQTGWFSPAIIKVPYIRYLHFAFCKSHERFELKKKWWETRFDEPFDYGWHIDENGKITDPDHDIVLYTGKFPEILHDHPLFKKLNNA